MTSNRLKCIAIVLMIIDHYAYVFLPYNDPFTIFLRFIGRFAAPIFCFLVAQGYHHTTDKFKYLLRLLAFAVVSHVPFVLLFEHPIFPVEKTSVLWSLSLGLLSLIIVNTPKFNIAIKLLLVLGVCFLADFGDWNFVAVLWVLSFGYFRETKLLQIIFFSAAGWVFYIQPNMGNIDLTLTELHPQYAMFGIFGALLFILMYNGKRGVKSRILSIACYVFYPLHLLVFYLINTMSG